MRPRASRRRRAKAPATSSTTRPWRWSAASASARRASSSAICRSATTAPPASSSAWSRRASSAPPTTSASAKCSRGTSSSCSAHLSWHPHLPIASRWAPSSPISWERVLFTTFALLLFALPALAEPALWVARQGDATVYLFPTVHALKPELKWETPKIEKAFAESREVWLEIEDPSPDPKAIQPLLRELGFDEAHPLSTKLGAADVKRLDAAAKSAGL